MLLRRIADAVLALGTATIVARALGPAGQGAYSLALLLPALIATLLNLGIAPATAYFTNKGVYQRDSVVVTAVYAGLLLGALGVAVGALVITFYGETLFPRVPEDLLWVSLALLPTRLAFTFLAAVFQGLKDFRTFLVVSISQRVALSPGYVAQPELVREFVVAGERVRFTVAPGDETPWNLHLADLVVQAGAE